MKIVKLESENIKRLKAIEIKPDGSLVIIGGKNAQGKTSVLDSIEMALAGGGSIPKEPIRKGEKKARVVVEMDNLIVTRTFTESGSKLIVSDKEGFTKTSPQALLDSLVGKLSFDPLAFSRMDSKKQLETLKSLVGIDFSKLDEEKKRIYDDRTLVNRDIKSLQAQVEAIEKYESIPDQELSYADMTMELEVKVKYNQRNQQERQLLTILQNQTETSRIELDMLKEEIKKLRERWDAALERDKEVRAKADEKFEEVRKLRDEEIDSFRTKITEAEEINSKIRSNNKRNELQFDLELRQQQSEKISRRLEDIESEKEKIISSSKLPIAGLSFDENGVIFNNLPLDQASSAELLLVSSSIGLSLNPKLRILLLRDGSLLDEDHLKLLAKWAEENEAQVWLETISEGKECQVIIEDGRVK